MGLLASKSGGFQISKSGGLALKDCCCYSYSYCQPCCGRIADIDGLWTFDGNGDLEIDTGDTVWTVILPRKNDRTICDGDIIEIQGVMKNGTYSMNPPYYWSYWNDRAWTRTDFGDANLPVDVEHSNYVLFNTQDIDSFARFRYN